jgi:hypothetical protein
MITEEITTQRDMQGVLSAVPDRPLLGNNPACGQCECPVNSEHFAYVEMASPWWMQTNVYCGHCHFGMQTLWHKVGGLWSIDFSIQMHGDEATKLRSIVEHQKCV